MLVERPIPAIVQQAEATERQLVERAQEALSSCNWIVGQCAAEWTERHAQGRTDADFGNMIGMSGDQVRQRRKVFQTFGDVSDTYPKLKWSHFYIALNWDDSAECLQWADEIEATVAEMKAWRRSQHGEDLSEPADEPNDDNDYEEHNPQPEPEPEPDDDLPTLQSMQGIAKETIDKPAVEGVRELRESKEPREDPQHEQSAPPRSALDQETPIESAIRRILNVNDAILAVRELVRLAKANYDENQLDELADELESCLKVIRPESKPAPAKVSKSEINQVVEEWNLLGNGLPLCRSVSDKRTRAIRQRLHDPFWRDHWREAMAKIPEIPWMLGDNQRGWVADIDFFIRPDTVLKIIEGGYGQAETRSDNDKAFDSIFGKGWDDE